VLRRTRLVSGDAQAARDLLIRSGGSSLSWITTWAANNYWFAPDGQAAIAYRVIGRVALSAGEPFGRPTASRAMVVGFAGFCAEHAWTPCLYSVGEAMRRQAEELGWQSVQVAEETVVLLDGLAFTGKKWQDVRTALNRASKAGITAEWIKYSHAPLAITDQIRAISEEWVADKGLPEMGFTLGGLDELGDDAVRCVIAVDADRTVHGVTSWLPVYRDGAVTGWTLDFMRRRESGFRGVMEFLIASAALEFQHEGAELMSLSGAPLARLDRGEQPDMLQRLLDISGRALEPVYGFRSLLAFKAKFQPEYRPLYMTFPDAAALPAIASAIGRAYLPTLDTTRTVRLLRKLRS
jgi:phosphatidylglycerol lysyltransferase